MTTVTKYCEVANNSKVKDSMGKVYNILRRSCKNMDFTQEIRIKIVKTRLEKVLFSDTTMCTNLQSSRVLVFHKLSEAGPCQ